MRTRRPVRRTCGLLTQMLIPPKMRATPSQYAGRPLAMLRALSSLCPLCRDRSVAFLGVPFSLSFKPSKFVQVFPLGLPSPLLCPWLAGFHTEAALLSFDSRDSPAFKIASIRLTYSFRVVV